MSSIIFSASKYSNNLILPIRSGQRRDELGAVWDNTQSDSSTLPDILASFNRTVHNLADSAKSQISFASKILFCHHSALSRTTLSQDNFLLGRVQFPLWKVNDKANTNGKVYFEYQFLLMKNKKNTINL